MATAAGDADQVPDEHPAATVGIIQLILPNKDTMQKQLRKILPSVDGDYTLSGNDKVVFPVKVLKLMG